MTAKTNAILDNVIMLETRYKFISSSLERALEEGDEIKSDRLKADLENTHRTIKDLRRLAGVADIPLSAKEIRSKSDRQLKTIKREIKTRNSLLSQAISNNQDDEVYKDVKVQKTEDPDPDKFDPDDITLIG